MILFVCSGNTCRSPLAAALARVHGVDARSAGLNADPGDPAAPEAVRVAKRYGADLSAHEARNVQAKLIGEASQVYAMTNYQAEYLKKRFPDYAERIHMLNPSISDPYGWGDDAYETCARELLAAMHNAGIL